MTDEHRKSKNIVTIITAFLVAGVLIFYTITFQVREIESAVVTTFGRPTHSINEPGLYFKLPFPFQKVHIFDSRIQVFEGVFEQTFTSDERSLILTAYVGWRICDPLRFLESDIGTVEDAGKCLEGLVSSRKNSVIGKHPFYHLVSTDSKDLKFGDIENEILTMVSSEAKFLYGIEIKIFGIKRLALPKGPTEAVFERMREERNRKATELRSQGEAEAEKIKAKAEADKEEILSKARSEAKKICGEGEARAAKFYPVFQKNLELSIFLRKLEALKKILAGDETKKGARPTLILDPSTPPFDLLTKLPQWLKMKKSQEESSGKEESGDKNKEEKLKEEHKEEDKKGEEKR